MGLSNLYIFRIHDISTYFILAPSWKTARNIVYQKDKANIDSLTDIKGKRILKNCSSETRICSTEEVYDNYAWWTCICGNNKFIPIDAGESCRCKCCNRETRVNRRSFL